jgi:hypothetical protein
VERCGIGSIAARGTSAADHFFDFTLYLAPSTLTLPLFSAQVNDFHPVVGLGMLCRWAFCENYEISFHLMILQPFPGKGVPVFGVIRFAYGIDPV